ncbi:(2Fe-2S) ferredoxin domain-containing protein [Acidipila sp. EB88]|uniref:(2Fe-2S) ferredoxin domain-containing protein n=1 Tax=Acidipila sp. EB88 TaxID=2305226 RepID=UPI000F600A4D|nr:(2Fe-2S) ferredoxin domain-containing protein [Acidipila sp. EB88]RRA47926.1 (2Fe-2S) ferredoxin domain-containing protein [Acidipila sp. EB88]
MKAGKKKQGSAGDTAAAPGSRTLFVCVRDRNGKGASCAGSGARALLKDMQAILAGEGIAPSELLVRPCGCLGLCKQGPVLVAAAGAAALNRKPPKVKKGKKRLGVYTQVEPDEARLVLRDALLGEHG